MNRRYFILAIMISNIVFAQKNLKTSKKDNGRQKEIFTYYTDPNSVTLNIKQGNYLYESKSPSSFESIKGKFNKDRKSGRWIKTSVLSTPNDYRGRGHYDKYSQYEHIDWTNGVKENGEYLSVYTTEEFQGISRLSINTNKCLWKYEKNVVRSLICSENKNGEEKQTINVVFDENGSLYPGEYCFMSCDKTDKYTLKIDEDKFIVALPEAPNATNHDREYATEIDEYSTTLVKRALKGELSEKELEEKNVKLSFGNYFTLMTPYGIYDENDEFIKRWGELVGIKGGENPMGQYILNRKIKLGNSIGNRTWYMIQAISDGKITDVSSAEIKFRFSMGTLYVSRNNGNGFSGDYELDGKKNIISLRNREENKIVPAYSVIDVSENQMKLKDLSNGSIYIFRLEREG